MFYLVFGFVKIKDASGDFLENIPKELLVIAGDIYAEDKVNGTKSICQIDYSVFQTIEEAQAFALTCSRDQNYAFPVFAIEGNFENSSRYLQSNYKLFSASLAHAYHDAPDDIKNGDLTKKIDLKSIILSDDQIGKIKYADEKKQIEYKESLNQAEVNELLYSHKFKFSHVPLKIPFESLLANALVIFLCGTLLFQNVMTLLTTKTFTLSTALFLSAGSIGALSLGTMAIRFAIYVGLTKVPENINLTNEEEKFHCLTGKMSLKGAMELKGKELNSNLLKIQEIIGKLNNHLEQLQSNRPTSEVSETETECLSWAMSKLKKANKPDVKFSFYINKLHGRLDDRLAEFSHSKPSTW